MRLAYPSLLLMWSFLARAAPAADVEAPVRPDPATVGSVWPSPPSAVGPAPAAGLEGLARLMRAGTHDEALVHAERVAREGGPDAPAAWMAAGVLHGRRHQPRLASAALRMVEADGGPLAPWALFERARIAFEHDRIDEADAACGTYLARHRDGSHAVDCMQVRALALAAKGETAPALALAEAWQGEVRHASIDEPVRLTLAAALADGAPDEAVRLLRPLTHTFTAPMTPVVAERLLAELRARGVDEATVPHDDDALRAKVWSMQGSGRLDDAWRVFQTLERRGASSPGLARWCDDSRTTLAWRTRRWHDLHDHYSRAYEEEPDADVAWSGFRATARGGLHEEARAWIARGLDHHADEGRWRSGIDTVAHALLVARDYPLARKLFGEMSGRRGSAGRTATVFAALSAGFGGKHRVAVEELTQILQDDPSNATLARYWRARSLDHSDPAAAARDRAWIREHDPLSWHGVLLRAGDGEHPRAGAWLQPESTPLLGAGSALRAPVVGAIHQPATRDPSQGYAHRALSWGAPPVPVEPWLAPEAVSPTTFATEAADTFAAFADRWGGRWPELRAIDALGRAGLVELSGPALSAWRAEYTYRLRRRDRTARSLSRATDTATWRQLYLHAGDHHDAARSLGSVWTRTEGAARELLRDAAWPLAHRDRVWATAESVGLDPYLILGLMRAESTYAAHAVSRVGARGPMQIMPRTGALMAWLDGDPTFTAGDLHDPDVAITYGARYLALLLKRFDGVFPLAVAAYNGGPHNVSAWLDGLGHDMPLDVFVASIPFSESRRYVRRVTTYYATYLNHREPTALITLPPNPRGDDASVVDF